MKAEDRRQARERAAYVALPSGLQDGSDALGIIDLDESSATYGQLLHKLDLPSVGDGRSRYSVARPSHRGGYSEILVSGTSSRIWPMHAPDPQFLMSSLDPNMVASAATVAVIDERSLVVTALESVSRPNLVAGFDMWASSSHGLLVSSEGCEPALWEKGVNWQSLRRGEYGHRLHVLDLDGITPDHTIDLGLENQMVLRLVGASRARSGCYGFASVLINARDLSSSVWCWFRHQGRWTAKKVIDIPAEPCPQALLPPELEELGAVPPLVTDIKLSPSDRFLYASCWGTGELLQYDVINPLQPRLTGTVRIGGIVQRRPHPRRPNLDGGPQSLRISNDGLRIYVTNSASGVLDQQFYPGKAEGWMVKFDSLPHGGLTLDDQFFVAFEHGLPQEILLSDEVVSLG